MNTDDYVIWFTVGEDLGHLSRPYRLSAARRGVKGWVESPMLGCVTPGSRNRSVAIQTDDVVIWVTGGDMLHDPRVTQRRA